MSGGALTQVDKRDRIPDERVEAPKVTDLVDEVDRYPAFELQRPLVPKQEISLIEIARPYENQRLRRFQAGDE